MFVTPFPRPAEEAQVDLRDPIYYINRELSWLEFNQRVLDQATSDYHPLLERVKFLAIVGSNLDEFYMVRVATLLKKQRVRAYLTKYFRREIFPLLTPLAFDPGHPFPFMSNRSRNFAIVVRHQRRTKFARVKVPDGLPRFVPLPGAIGSMTFVFRRSPRARSGLIRTTKK